MGGLGTANGSRYDPLPWLDRSAPPKAEKKTKYSLDLIFEEPQLHASGWGSEQARAALLCELKQRLVINTKSFCCYHHRANSKGVCAWKPARFKIRIVVSCCQKLESGEMSKKRKLRRSERPELSKDLKQKKRKKVHYSFHFKATSQKTCLILNNSNMYMKNVIMLWNQS